MSYKVRFGYTIGPELSPEELPAIVADLEELEFDSIWIPEAFLAPTLDPIVALSWAAAATTKLKLGSHLIIPGKNPVQLARQLAHLDRLSNGRLLIVGVLGLPDEADAGAQILDRRDRGRVMNEVVPLLRRLWTGELIDHDGPRYSFTQVQVNPTPHQEPLEIWLAGRAPSALRRVGSLGDGYMPGLSMPADVASLLPDIHAAAAEAGREMDREHFGVNLIYNAQPLSSEVHERLEARRPPGSSGDLVPIGWSALRDRVDEWLEVGVSKFLLRPAMPPSDHRAELQALAENILPLTT